MNKIQKIILSFLAITTVGVSYAGEGISFQIINNTADHIFKHCRVSPTGYESTNGDTKANLHDDYLSSSGMNKVDLSIILDKYIKVLSVSRIGKIDVKTCGIFHKNACSGFIMNESPLIRPDLDKDIFSGKTAASLDVDIQGLAFELNMRYASAVFKYPKRGDQKSIDYKGWSTYNVSVGPGGSFVQGIEKTPPLLQIECDLYDSSDHYDTTFGFILRDDQINPIFFKGGDEHLDSGTVSQMGAIKSYKIDYK